MRIEKKKLLLLLSTWFVLSVSYAKTLIIETTTDSPPFVSLADNKNHFYGFDIDIMLRICQMIQENCEFKPVLISKLGDKIVQGKADLAISAIIIPSVPLNNLIFSLPYLPSNGQVMVRADSNIKDFKDLLHKKIGVRHGTLFFGGSLFKDHILSVYGDKIDIIEYSTIDDLLYALSNEDVDAIFSNEKNIQFWYMNNKELYRLVGSKIPIGDGYGIMAKIGNEDLMTRINQALMKMEADGSYLQIYKRYF